MVVQVKRRRRVAKPVIDRAERLGHSTVGLRLAASSRSKAHNTTEVKTSLPDVKTATSSVVELRVVGSGRMNQRATPLRGPSRQASSGHRPSVSIRSAQVARRTAVRVAATPASDVRKASRLLPGKLAPANQNSRMSLIARRASLRQPSLPMVVRELTRHPLARTASPARSDRTIRSQRGQTRLQTRPSRPASNLAQQVSGGRDRQRSLPSGSPPPARQRSGPARANTSSVVEGNESGGASGSIQLLGDLVVDGRKLGEFAAKAASRGGSASMTASRSTNFRKTAVPNGLSAPMP